MRSLLFPISGFVGRALATAHMLNAASGVIPAASSSELHYIWKQLKDKHYVWRVAGTAYTERHTPENQAIIRLVSFFWAAEIRPSGEQLSPEAAAFIEKVAFPPHSAQRPAHSVSLQDRRSVFSVYSS